MKKKILIDLSKLVKGNIISTKLKNNTVEIQYDNVFSIKSLEIKENKFYKVRTIDEDVTWFMKISEVDINDRVYTNFYILIWDNEKGHIDGISLSKDSWWGDECEISSIEECNESEKEACIFLFKKYTKELKNLNINEDNLEIKENWFELLKKFKND